MLIIYNNNSNNNNDNNNDDYNDNNVDNNKMMIYRIKNLLLKLRSSLS